MSTPGVPATSRPTSVSSETLEAILSRHRIKGRQVVPIARLSAGNTIYLLGEDLVLRIPHERVGGDYDLNTMRVAITAAKSAGVRTPQILVFDDARELVAVPYVIMERVPGEPISMKNPAPQKVPQVWRELGHDLALLHNGVRKDGPAGQLKVADIQTDPRPWIEELASDRLLSLTEAEWMLRWLDELDPLVCKDAPLVFCHGDLNADNLLVRPEVFEYLAIVDWDAAGWIDPAWDFVPLPLLSVPFVLEGYRQIAQVPGDSTVEARILWHHLQYTLYHWWRARHQGRSVIDRGFGRLKPGIRELLKLPGAGWMKYLA